MAYSESPELELFINAAEGFIETTTAEENSFTAEKITTSDAEGYITVTQTVMGWIDSITILPGTITTLGEQEVMFRFNEILEASAIKVASKAFTHYSGQDCLDGF